MPLLEHFEIGLNNRQALAVGSHLEVVLFRDLDNDVHHIREAAAAAAHFPQFVIDLSRDDELPGVLVEEAADHRFDVPRRDDVALADEHRQAPGTPGSVRGSSGSVRFLRIDSCLPGVKVPATGATIASHKDECQCQIMSRG
jgi:hypothetical protein